MMPRVIGDASLIARVNEVEGVMHRQSNELGKLNRAVKKYKDENAKLREYVEWIENWVLGGFFTKDIESEIEIKRRELGIEVK